KRTCLFALHMSAFDPKRTSHAVLEIAKSLQWNWLALPRLSLCFSPPWHWRYCCSLMLQFRALVGTCATHRLHLYGCCWVGGRLPYLRLGGSLSLAWVCFFVRFAL